MTSLFLEYETKHKYLVEAKKIIGKRFYWSKTRDGEEIPYSTHNVFLIQNALRYGEKVYLFYTYSSGFLESDDLYEHIMKYATPVDSLSSVPST